MTDLLFRVKLSGRPLAEENAPSIALGMPGMHMGPNRVQMKPVSPGVYEGKGIIVRCPSGKRTWQADVTVPGHGRISFIFDVRY
jgi:hypothetical protein